MQKSLFDNRFDKSKSLSDFLPSYKNRSDCYQSYIDYVTKKFIGTGDICECCHQKTHDSKTFKASWKFEYLDTASSLSTLSSLLAFIIGLFGNSIFILTFKRMDKIQFATLHVACFSCSTKIKLWRLLSKILQVILATLMIVSLIQFIFMVIIMFAQPQTASIFTVGIIFTSCALGLVFTLLAHKSEKIGLLGDLSKIAKNPVILESIKFHKACHR
jgi:ABC-type multidrug transport system permease subunit